MYLKAHDTCFENTKGKVKVLYWIPQLLRSAENLSNWRRVRPYFSGP